MWPPTQDISDFLHHTPLHTLGSHKLKIWKFVGTQFDSICKARFAMLSLQAGRSAPLLQQVHIVTFTTRTSLRTARTFSTPPQNIFPFRIPHLNFERLQPLDEFQKYSTHLANSKGQKLLSSEFARSKADHKNRLRP